MLHALWVLTLSLALAVPAVQWAAKAGSGWDPDGGAQTEAGSQWDPDGGAQTEAGSRWDPNG
jgi:hypothetical protein